MLSYPDFKEKTVVIVFCTEGQKFSFLNDNLIVKDKDENTILQTTCYRTLALWIVGGCSITSGLLERSKKFAFPVLLLSYNFRCIGVWNAPTEGNFLLRKKQYDYQDLTIARHLINNKISNQLLALKSIRKKEDNCKNAIENLNIYITQLQTANDLNSILGIEGVAAKVYFTQWFAEMNWIGRKPRTKHDTTNVLLDMGYTFLFYLVENMLHLYGFDIYQGVYHTNFYKRKSLVCDLQEPFRCIIDRQVKKAFGLGQIKPEDFEEKKGQYFLKFNKSKDYTRWMLTALLEYKADIFLYCQQYYRAFIRNKPIEEYPCFNIDEPK
ncbi:MAG: type V CRISPR-associated endonuclease Cas1 [Bacteroidia bacterium]|nr:type V CRISPR-associated endonuclease Cas1 [Bacteroidia bacterium]